MRRCWAAAACAALNSAISCGPILTRAANSPITATTSITAIPVAITISTICSTSGFAHRDGRTKRRAELVALGQILVRQGQAEASHGKCAKM